jgi:hypothetical protein
MDTDSRDRIEQFIAIVEKVKNARFTRETKSVGFQLKFKTGEPLQQKVIGFDEEDLRSMLLDLRKFTLEKDGVRLSDICDLLIADTENQEIVANLQKCKDNYGLLMHDPAIQMIVDGEIETNVVKKWLYGHYFHEEQYQEELKNLGLGQPLHKMNFVVAITELIKLCVVAANNAKRVLDAN